MNGLDPNLIARLKEASGAGGWSEDTAEIAPHLVEWRGRWTGTTPLLLQPASTSAVARILALCNETNTPIVPQGGNTGLVGGQIPTQGEVLLSLTRLNKIRAVSTLENTLTAEAGVILADVQKAADAAERLFPLSLAAEGSCTIGGNVSTNAGGVSVLRYGMMRDLVIGLEVVLADGSVLDVTRGLRKDNTGYDLKQLFIGAEGTLGIVTAVMLRLFPKPRGYATAMVALSSVGVAVELLNRLQQATGGMVSAYELIERRALDLVVKHISGTTNPIPDHPGWSILVEISNPAGFDANEALEQALGLAMDEGFIQHAVFAKSERDREKFWRLRETIPEAQRKDGASIANDVSVPLSRLEEFIRVAEDAVRKILPQARAFSFGHAGDGNLHFAVQAPGHDAALAAARAGIERAMQDVVEGFQGSISAEHGLGLARNAAAARGKSPVEIALMRALKRTLDPNNILNPGKLLPPD